MFDPKVSVDCRYKDRERWLPSPVTMDRFYSAVDKELWVEMSSTVFNPSCMFCPGTLFLSIIDRNRVEVPVFDLGLSLALLMVICTLLLWRAKVSKWLILSLCGRTCLWWSLCSTASFPPCCFDGVRTLLSPLRTFLEAINLALYPPWKVPL